MAVDKRKDQISELEDEAEVLRAKTEKGVAQLTQSCAEEKLVLATIDGGGKGASAAPGAAGLLLGIESMQKTYTGFFSGTESTTLPQDVKDRQQEFEAAFTQRSSLATKLAEYQQQISKAMV